MENNPTRWKSKGYWKGHIDFTYFSEIGRSLKAIVGTPRSISRSSRRNPMTTVVKGWVIIYGTVIMLYSMYMTIMLITYKVNQSMIERESVYSAMDKRFDHIREELNPFYSTVQRNNELLNYYQANQVYTLFYKFPSQKTIVYPNGQMRKISVSPKEDRIIKGEVIQ